MDRRSLIFIIALMIALFFVNQWFSSRQEVSTTYTTSKNRLERIEDEFAAPLNALSTPAFPHSSKEEEYFVLQNEYQQIVFSNIGGSIAEINLPFQSKQNLKSFVRPIHLDRVFLEEYTLNDHFPAFPYYINDGSGVKKVDQPKLGGFYPLLRRTLFNTLRETVIPHSPIKHYALKITSDNFLSRETNLYTLKRLEKDLIEFELTDSDRKINKIFRFPKEQSDAPYCLEVSIKIDGDARGLCG